MFLKNHHRHLDMKSAENLELYKSNSTSDEFNETRKEIERQRFSSRNEIELEKNKKCFCIKVEKARDLYILNPSNQQKHQNPGDKIAKYTKFDLPEFLFGMTDPSKAVVGCIKPYFDELLDENVLKQVRDSQGQSRVPTGLFVTKVLILFRTICQWYKNEEGSVLFSEDDLDDEGLQKLHS